VENSTVILGLLQIQCWFCQWKNWNWHWAALPPQNCSFLWGICTPSTGCGSLGPPESTVHKAKRYLDRFSCFAGLTIVTDRHRPTDRQTDHSTAPVTEDRIYVHSTAMRHNNRLYQYCKFTSESEAEKCDKKASIRW